MVEKETTELLGILLDVYVLLRPSERFYQYLRRYRLGLVEEVVEEQLQSGGKLVFLCDLGRKYYLPELGQVEQHLQVAIHVASVTVVHQPPVVLAELLLCPESQHHEHVRVYGSQLHPEDFSPVIGRELFPG